MNKPVKIVARLRYPVDKSKSAPEVEKKDGGLSEVMQYTEIDLERLRQVVETSALHYGTGKHREAILSLQTKLQQEFVRLDKDEIMHCVASLRLVAKRGRGCGHEVEAEALELLAEKLVKHRLNL